jgi:succinyl-diaminopimelate desuccinylase
MDVTDPLSFAQALMRRRSVTPHDDGAMALVEDTLKSLGFMTQRLTFGASDGRAPIENLYAQFGSGQPHFCFAGHTDVVPVGDASAWEVDPFAAIVKDGWLIGRGAVDMKGAIAAMIAATARTLKQGAPSGTLSFLITGDEEGLALDGTTRVIDWMVAQGHVPDWCLVGEPTSAVQLGDMIKIGRRGSVNIELVFNGVQGHVAYPQRADNPITRLVRALERLKRQALDEGNAWFEPSNLEITDLTVGNPTENLIPAQARARLNIRFNTRHSAASLVRWVEQEIAQEASDVEMQVRVSGEAFLTKPGFASDRVHEAIRMVVGKVPELSTTGGTSDARFIRSVCPVVEFGLVGSTMHKVDERTNVQDLYDLTNIYQYILQN